VIAIKLWREQGGKGFYAKAKSIPLGHLGQQGRMRSGCEVGGKTRDLAQETSYKDKPSETPFQGCAEVFLP